MEANQTLLLLKRTLARLKESQVIVGSVFSLITLFALFVIGTVGNVLLFIQIKNYALTSNKLHLLNLVISNLLILNIVLPANFFAIIRAKPNIDSDQADENPASSYNQLVKAEDCESESTLTLIAFYCHLFNFLIFFTIHLKLVHKTKFFYLNWFKLRKEFAFSHGQTAKSNEPLNRNEFSNQKSNSNEMASNELPIESSELSTNRSSNSLMQGLKGLSKWKKPSLNNASTNRSANGRPKDLNNISNLLDELQSNQLTLSASLNYLASQQVACQQVVNKQQRTKSDLAAFTTTGQTIADLILIRIRNFVLCFLTAWTFALSLAVLNDLSHEQFSACSIRYRLCAFWFKDLMASEKYDQAVRSDQATAQPIDGDRSFSSVNGHSSPHNLLDKFSKFGNQTTTFGNGTFAGETTTAATLWLTANESEFQSESQNQTTAQLAFDDAPQYLSNLLSKIERYQSAPSVHYTILAIELIVIFAATLITIVQLVHTFLNNRTYRIVPQSYLVEASALDSRREEFVCENKRANPTDQRGKRSDKATDQHADNQTQALDGNNEGNEVEIESKISTRLNELTSLADRLNDLSNSVVEPGKAKDAPKKKRLGRLKNEREIDRAIRMNAEQIINLSDDFSKDERKEEENGRNRPEGAGDASSVSDSPQPTSEHQTSSASGEARVCLPNRTNQAANYPPVANDFMNTNSNTVCYHSNHCNCSQQFSESANYYLNRRQRFNHLDCRTEQVVSASSIWTQHTAGHSEQKRFAAVFVLIYLLFFISWLPFGLTILTARLATWSIKEAATNRTEPVYADLSRMANRSSAELDRSEPISDSQLKLIDSNLSGTNRTETNNARPPNSVQSSLAAHRAPSDDRRRTSETMLHKIQELDFRFINRLWFATLFYSAFSAYFFPIINRQSLANFIQRTAKQKLNRFVHFISNH